MTLNLRSVIFLQACQPHTNRSGYFCDRLMLKEHPLFQLDKEALQIFLYYDHVEMCNSLGSKKTVHKARWVTHFCPNSSRLVYKWAYFTGLFYYNCLHHPPQTCGCICYWHAAGTELAHTGIQRRVKPWQCTKIWLWPWLFVSIIPAKCKNSSTCHQLLRVPQMRTKLWKKAFSFRGALRWNGLPASIRASRSNTFQAPSNLLYLN